MAVTSKLLSVAEFASFAQPAQGVRQELHHGQVVEMPPVKKLHTQLQQRLVSLLSGACDGALYGVDKEFPFRPAPEYEVWVADVAVFDLSRWEETPDDDYFRGVPAIVIEVISPSNKASEMMEREDICLRHGGQEFWLIDPERENCRVVRASGPSSVHAADDVLKSPALRRAIAVQDIFAR